MLCRTLFTKRKNELLFFLLFSVFGTFNETSRRQSQPDSGAGSDFDRWWDHGWTDQWETWEVQQSVGRTSAGGIFSDHPAK